MVVFALLGLWKEIWAIMAKVPGAMKSGWARLVGWLGEARKALREARTKVRAWKAWDEARSSLKGAPSQMEVAWTAVIEWKKAESAATEGPDWGSKKGNFLGRPRTEDEGGGEGEGKGMSDEDGQRERPKDLRFGGIGEKPTDGEDHPEEGKSQSIGVDDGMDPGSFLARYCWT
ncbi:hypothetical protein SAPIO_CDS8011 [Scedosporium apiospermum]|uniref:Uncharacterized protein n=1 Tax=Pseudallescheria apiosperma TaxID=563466 RepID=A0A084G0F6_PSEDA|nr:uncharacterized protein SAPIO_CDS8011 [Scedosporium apiospermum]KEZ40818.1 hypothetical protein SAPIO_CDS8011 [Scedosporium apiospermum]